MPITVQCRSCAARYNVVDSAAGRRVKCRRCGGSFNVPGGVEEGVAPPMDLRAMGELERTGQLVVTSAESEYEQYKTAVAEMAKPKTAAVKKDYQSIHDLATPDAKRKFGLDGSAPGKASSGGGGGGLTALVFLGAAGLAVLSIFVPAVLLVNLIVGSVVGLGGAIWGAVLAFQESVGKGLAVIFVPFYALIYLSKGGSRTRGALVVWLGGNLLVFFTRMAVNYGDAIRPK